MGDGSIISKFPGIARDIDLFNKPFFSKVAKRALWQKMLTELSEKLWTQFSRDLMDVSGQKRKENCI